MDGRQRVAVGQHCQALNDRCFGVMLTVEDCPARFGDDLFTGGALPTLAAFAGESELPQISRIDAPIIGALFIPTKGIWSD